MHTPSSDGQHRGGIRAGIARVFRLPLRRRADVEADAAAELDAFLSERVADLVRHGMPVPDARAEAQRRLGASVAETTALLQDSARTRERRLSVRQFLDDLRLDVRYALRTLGRDRVFTFFAILIAGLGIGASVTVFSIANAVLLRPLPFPDARALTWIANHGESGLSGATMQSRTLLDVREQGRSFRDVAGYVPFYEADNTTYTSAGESARLTSVPVTGNFFQLLGVPPMLGRSFTEEESSGSGPAAVMLSYSTWSGRLAADSSVIGRPLVLNDEPVTVVGVLPATFDFASIFAPGTRVDVFVPFPLTERTDWMGNTLTMIGRLRPGASVASAQGEMTAIAARLAAANPRRNAFSPTVVSLNAHVSGDIHAALVVLLVSVGVVMVIVCANLSHLLLARGSTRSKEVAVRIALGAGRGRLSRQLLTESSILAVGGAALGVLVALAGTHLLSGLTTFSIPLLDTVTMDGTALGFAALLTLLSGLAFGLAPALTLPTHDVSGALKSSSRGSTGTRRSQWTRDALIVSEIALACVLVIVAGLLTRSLLKVLDVDPGFRPAMVAAVRVDPGKEHRTSAARFVAYVDQVLARTRALPGVESAGLCDGLPLGGNRSWGAGAQGVVYTPSTMPSAFVRVISDGYVGAMGMRLVNGRDFTRQDDFSSARVIIINASMARTLFPGQRAIDRIVVADTLRRVVGIVGDVRHLALDASAGNEMYIPFRQSSDFSAVHVVARTTMAPEAFTRGLRIALQQIVPNLPAKDFQTLQGRVDHALSPRRFTTALLNGFALFAVLLALLGIHGVVTYTVNQRTQELGVRLALGASATRLKLGIVRHTLTLAALGMAFGTAASFGLVRWVGGFLFGVTSTDPLTFAAMLGTLTIVAAISGYLPARRVSRIDPLSALRSGA